MLATVLKSQKNLVAQASRLYGRLAGGDARSTHLFMIYGWAIGPCATVTKSSRRVRLTHRLMTGNGGQCPSYT
jgi:hypothetical protein